MPFMFKRLEIPEIILVHCQCFKDSRGCFIEMYKRSVFSENGISCTFVQENYSYSVRHVLRGLHYQIDPKAQGKLVRVIRGEVFDVAVDLREGSPSYGAWVGTTLSEKRPEMMYIPPGFAHGFCVLSKEAGFQYKVTEEYSREHERGLLWSDPEIGIQWPISQPIVSPKDAQLPCLKDADINFVY